MGAGIWLMKKLGDRVSGLWELVMLKTPLILRFISKINSTLTWQHKLFAESWNFLVFEPINGSKDLSFHQRMGRQDKRSPNAMSIGLSMIGSELFGLTRLKLIDFNRTVSTGVGKGRGKTSNSDMSLRPLSMVEETSWYGAPWLTKVLDTCA